jgi:hypothetical protein
LYQTEKALYPEMVEEFFGDEPEAEQRQDRELSTEHTELLNDYE